jgi:pSer/pThr/pTyr-binding forkhead associated (FHA) protein
MPLMPKLIVTEKGTGKKQTFEFAGEGATIGRAGENLVNLADPNVSRSHAKIVVSGSNCFLVDLGSDNGTFLNGSKVKSNEQVILRHGDMISIESFNLGFNMIDEMLAQSFNEVTDSDIIEVKLLKKVLRAIDKESVPSLEVLNGNFVGKKFFISADIEEAVIGRDETADLEIKEYVISRNHAKVKRGEESVVICDMGSKNGTYVNNRRVTEQELHDGDRIALGTIVLIYRNPKEVDMEEISAQARKRRAAEGPPAGEEAPLQAVPSQEAPEGAEEGLTLEDAGQLPEETPDEYPVPRARRERIRLSLFEMSLIGVGVVIFIFAVISFINLVAK